VRLRRDSPRILAACLLLATAQIAVQAQAQVLGAAGVALAPSREPHDILVMLRLPPEHMRPNTLYGGDYGEDPSTRKARRRQAQRIAQRHGLELIEGTWLMPLLALDCFVMRVHDGRSVEDAAGAVSREPLVAWSQPVNTFHARGNPIRFRNPRWRRQQKQGG
jgi:hypothetical protein